VQGCVHVYTGNGKGKTTAAVGLAVRAAGQGLRVAFVQFLKTGASGEVPALEKLGVTVVSPPAPEKFLWQMDAAEKMACAAGQQAILARAAALMPTTDLLVLDEVICTLEAGLVPRAQLDALLDSRPAALELVLTGRGADAALLARADYATEMRCLAHSFEAGRPACKGIEY